MSVCIIHIIYIQEERTKVDGYIYICMDGNVTLVRLHIDIYICVCDILYIYIYLYFTLDLTLNP
jgi:hypothetical protein